MEEAPKSNSRKKVMEGSCMGSSCGCGMCMAHCHWGYHLLRFVLGLIVILMVFWLGMQVGKMKALYGDDGGYGFGRHQMMSYRQAPMMYEYQLGQPYYNDNGDYPVPVKSSATPSGKTSPTPK